MTHFTTKAVHSGHAPNKKDGAIIPPIHLTTTFTFGNEEGYEYSRSGNPTRKILEETLAVLDNASFGLAFSSGSAALATAAALLKKDEEILFSSDAYGGTYRYITEVLAPQGLRYHTADLTDLTATEKIVKRNNVKLIWAETPTNPLLKVVNISELAKIAHKHNALLAIDNTFATPILQQPIALGADIVAYSTTKYINGHSDSVGGSLIVNSESLYKQLAFLQNAIGAVLSPFDSWLTLRGLRTLELRMERHVANAQKLVYILKKHSKVKRVYFPGSLSKEQQRIVEKQMTAPGAMISIELAEEYDPQDFIAALRYFPLAESLGGIESLIDHPASMTHASIPKQEREKIGLSDNLFRISVGIENSQDLTKDISQALDSLTTKNNR